MAITIKKAHLEALIAAYAANEKYLCSSPGGRVGKKLFKWGLLDSRANIANRYLDNKRHWSAIFFKRKLTTRKVTQVSIPLRDMTRKIIKLFPEPRDEQEIMHLDNNTAATLAVLCRLNATYATKSNQYLLATKAHYNRKCRLGPIEKEIGMKSGVIAAQLKRQLDRLPQPKQSTGDWIKEKSNNFFGSIQNSWETLKRNTNEFFKEARDGARDVAEAAIPFYYREISPAEIEQQRYGKVTDQMQTVRDQFNLHHKDHMDKSAVVPMEELGAILNV